MEKGKQEAKEVRCERCSYWVPSVEAYYTGIDDDGWSTYDTWLCDDCAMAEGIPAALEERIHG